MTVTTAGPRRADELAAPGGQTPRQVLELLHRDAGEAGAVEERERLVDEPRELLDEERVGVGVTAAWPSHRPPRTAGRHQVADGEAPAGCEPGRRPLDEDRLLVGHQVMDGVGADDGVEGGRAVEELQQVGMDELDARGAVQLALARPSICSDTSTPTNRRHDGRRTARLAVPTPRSPRRRPGRRRPARRPIQRRRSRPGSGCSRRRRPRRSRRLPRRG